MTVTAAVIVATTRVYDMPGLLALAPWTDDDTLIEWQLAQVLAAGIRDVEVVIPPDGDAIIPLVARDNVEVVIDTRNAGVASAIQVGVTALPRGTAGALIIDVAQPRVSELLMGLVTAHNHSDAAVTRAASAGAAGAPFVAGDTAIGALRNVADDDGLSRVLASFADRTVLWQSGDPVVLRGIRSESDFVAERASVSGS